MLFLRLLVVLSLCWPLWISAAQAQSSEKILVVAGSDIPSSLERDVTSALERAGAVMDSAGYTGNLRARHQAPDSEEALTKLAPQMGASLIAVLSLSRGKLEVTFRDGHTGRVIGEQTLPARGKRHKLPGPAQRKLAGAARRALSKVGPAPSSATERSYAQPVSQPRPAPRQSQVQAAPVAQAQEEEDEEQEEEEESEASNEQGSEDRAASDATAAQEDPIAFVINAGGGVGTRSILVPTSPTRGVSNQIQTGYAPALDVALNLEVSLSSHWLLRAGGAYRTVFGLAAPWLLPTGAVQESSLSSHSVMVGASLGYLTNGRKSLSLHLFLGWHYRGLSASEPTLPSASISGTAIRPELHIPFANGVVMLRLAPELVVVLNPQAKLPGNVAGLNQVGFAFGGEVSLDVRISSAVGLGVQYRESRASTSSGWGVAAVENERYIIGRLDLRL